MIDFDDSKILSDYGINYIFEGQIQDFLGAYNEKSSMEEIF